MKIRVGMGFDVHQLEEGRDFFLGGVKLPSSKGAVGHSDADVLIHAICDALLGAANLRDIGFHYSNKDVRWKGKDSKYFLQDVTRIDRKSTRLNSSHVEISYAVFCLKKKKKKQ